MKRILFLAIVALLVSSSVYAQVFTFGPKAGFTFSRFNFDESALDESISISDLPSGRRVGVVAGGFMQLNLGPFVFQPELLFSHSTGQMRLGDASFSDLLNVRLNQVDIPLLVGVNLGKTVRLQAGPVMGYVWGVGSAPGAGNVLDAFVNDFENKNWGYQMGGGVDLGRLALDVRYGGSLGKRTMNVEVDGSSYPIEVGRSAITVTEGINILK